MARQIDPEFEQHVRQIIREARERAIAEAGGPEKWREQIERIADQLEKEGVFDDLDPPKDGGH